MSKNNAQILGLDVYSLGANASAIASKDKKNIGKKADPEDIKAAKQNIEVPILDKRTNTLDVTAPLHANNGKVLYVMGITYSLRTDFGYIHSLVAKMLIIGVLALLIFSLVFYRIFVRMISKPLHKLIESARLITNGDLSVTQEHSKRNDEIGQLSYSFNEMSSQLKEVIGNVRISSRHIVDSMEELTTGATNTAEASNEIYSIIQEVATGSEKQVRSAEDNATAMDEIATGVQRVAASSSDVAGFSNDVAKEVTKGNESVQQAVLEMNNIDSAVQELDRLIENLSSNSQEINTVVAIITDIASQTSLLALNASIEAARAGEGGKGFAVVANEVKKLSEQSSHSAKQITDMIHTVQEETQKSSISMNIVRGRVKEGIDSVSIAGQSFEDILTKMQEVTAQIEEVSATSQEMSAGTEQVTASIDEMSKIAKNASDQTNTSFDRIQEQLESMHKIQTITSDLNKSIRDLEQKILHFVID